MADRPVLAGLSAGAARTRWHFAAQNSFR